MKKLKQIMMSLALSSLFVVPAFAVVGTVGAQPSIQQGLEQGTCLSVTGECDVEDPETAVDSIITTIINVFSLVVGVVSVIMIIIGGLKYITSGGNDGNVAGAKNTILYAIIGLVIVALAQVIVRFVLGRVTGN